MRILVAGIGLALVVATMTPPPAMAEDKIFPPGTECANLPTIADRLLCGRQELRRGEQPENVPAPPYDGYIRDEGSVPPPSTPDNIIVPPPPQTAPATGAPGAEQPQ